MHEREGGVAFARNANSPGGGLSTLRVPYTVALTVQRNAQKVS